MYIVYNMGKITKCIKFFKLLEQHKILYITSVYRYVATNFMYMYVAITQYEGVARGIGLSPSNPLTPPLPVPLSPSFLLKIACASSFMRANFPPFPPLKFFSPLPPHSLLPCPPPPAPPIYQNSDWLKNKKAFISGLRVMASTYDKQVQQIL